MTREKSVQLVLNLMQTLSTLRRKLAVEFRLEPPHPRLNRTQCLALMILHFEQGHHLTRVSELLNLEKGSMSSVFHFLIRHGYVRRDPDPQDRRRARLGLTEQGEGMCRQLEKQMADQVAERLQGLPAQDEQALEKAADTLAQISTRL